MASQQIVAQPEGYAQAHLGCARHDFKWDAPPKARSQQTSSCPLEFTGYNPPARQPSGGSPCSSSVSSDGAMDYRQCTLSQLQQQQQQQQLIMEDSGSFAGMDDGWFSKCRGCGCMTAHEQSIDSAHVPFCRRCQVTLHAACPRMRVKMVDTLLYVHQAWSDAGL